MRSLYQWATHNRLIAFVLLAWLLLLITPVTWHIFFNLAKALDMPVATAYGALLGLPAVVFGFVKYRLSATQKGGSNVDES